MTRISFIVAVSENNVIGDNNHLIWHLPNDLKHFKALTWGKPIIMGRKTYESIGRPLPGRQNVVLSRGEMQLPGCNVVRSVAETFTLLSDANEVCIIGGGEIYRLFLPWVNRFYITQVKARLYGETTFPAINWQEWQEVSRQDFARDERHAYDYSFVTLEKR